MTAATTAAATTTEFASLHDGIQLRSSSFQLIKVFFDEEATSDRIERFRALLLKLRYPASVYGFFCFSQTYSKMNLACTGISRSGLQASEISSNNGNNMNGDNNPESDIGNSLTPLESGDFYAPSLKSKEKSSDALRHFAKNTLRKAGLMPRTNNRKLPQASQNLQLIRTPETVRKSMQSNVSYSGAVSNSGESVGGHVRQNSVQMDSDTEEVLSSKLTNRNSLVLTFPSMMINSITCQKAPVAFLEHFGDFLIILYPKLGAN